MATAWPNTDFTKSGVAFSEILSGGPGKDGVPAISDPKMRPALSAADLSGREPVIAVEIRGEAPRAYPIRNLTWHEIVNERIGAAPLAITFCPICNSAAVFDRRLGDHVLEFGVSGLLRRSDMVMFDRQTESWWRQFIGEAIVGDLTGARLNRVPASLEDWDAFRRRNPDGLVMAEPTAWRRNYGANPYAGYDRGGWSFLYRGDPPPYEAPPLARVIAVGDRAWPLERLAQAGEIVEGGVCLTWREGRASALDAGRNADGRDVGSVRAFDAATGAALVHDVAFAFTFHAFHPDGEWMPE